MKTSVASDTIPGAKWWLLALIGAFILPAVELIPSGVVGLAARFFTAAAAAVVVLRSGTLGRVLRRSFLLVAGACFCGVAITSVAWSDFWQLTLFKGGLAVTTLVAGGAVGWAASRHGSKRSPLYPYAVLGGIWVLLTALAVVTGGAWHPLIDLFQGPCTNPNMFASVTAVLALPTALAFRRSKWRLVRLTANAGWIVAGLALVASGSRGGLLIWVSAVAFSSYGHSLGRKSSRLVILAVALIFVAYFAGFGPIQQRVDSILYKSDTLDTERDIFSSRRGPWELASESAAMSGLLGSGFGVFPGERPEGMSWLTTVGYGFESGSGWYSVQMQLGLPGLIAYVLLGGALVVAAVTQLRLRGSRGRRGGYSWTFLGIAIGLYVHSFFEAWLVSPGSPENAMFWCVIGTFAGLRIAEGKLVASQSPSAPAIRKRATGTHPVVEGG